MRWPLVQGTAAKRAEQLRRMVGDYGQCSELAHVTVPLPLDPAVMLTGIIPEECSVFKSALSPLRLTFRTAGMYLPGRVRACGCCAALKEGGSVKRRSEVIAYWCRCRISMLSNCDKNLG